jgi:hypothetical protein
VSARSHPIRGHTPSPRASTITGSSPISPSAYTAEGAIVRGNVSIGERASVWFNAVVRGDEGPVRIDRCGDRRRLDRRCCRRCPVLCTVPAPTLDLRRAGATHSPARSVETRATPHRLREVPRAFAGASKGKMARS